MALAVLAGCGSTVPLPGRPASLQQGGLTPSGGGNDAGTTPTGGANDAGITPSGAATPDGAGSASAGSRASAGPVNGGALTGPAEQSVQGSQASPAGTKLTATWTGVTASTISLGLSVAGSATSTGSQVANAYGFGGFTSPPDHAVQDALIKYVNTHGGVNGRRLVAVYDTYDPNSTAPYDQQSQQTCTYFTQDHKVFAHLDTVSNATFFQCMEQAGTVGIENYDIGTGTGPLQYPGIFYGSDLNAMSTGALLADGLVAQGFLTRRDRIGLIQEDLPVFDQARINGLESHLEEHGLSLTDVYKIAPINQSSDTAVAITDTNSAVLKFKTDGIDRIMFLTGYGALVDAIFMKDASEQHYYPEYGLSTHDGPAALTGGNAPADQLAGSRGVGWEPVTDISTPPPSTVSPASSQCLAILESEGVPAPTDAGQRNGELQFCEAFFLFTTIADRAGADLTRSSFIAAGNSLGNAFVSPLTVAGATAFGPGTRNDGPHLWVPVAYGTTCDCYSVSGPVQSIR